MSRESALLERLLENGIKPHAERICAIANDGAVAVLLFEIDAKSKPAAYLLGWDGRASVFPLAEKHRRDGLADADAVTRRWLQRESPGLARMLVLCQSGSLLVNYSPQRGYWLEPGSNTPVAEVRQ